MSQPSGGISGLGVSVVTAGLFMVYAGFLDRSPLDILRSLAGGSLPSVKAKSSSVHSSASVNASYVTTGGGNAAFVAGCQQYAADHYSEARRNQPGYSDCSSFVCKGIRASGVAGAYIGGWPRTTITLKSWSRMRRVDDSEMQPGDLAISDTNGSGAHVVMITGPGAAIGQQNPRENVRSGPLGDLMTVPYHIYRYTAPTTIGA